MWSRLLFTLSEVIFSVQSQQKFATGITISRHNDKTDLVVALCLSFSNRVAKAKLDNKIEKILNLKDNGDKLTKLTKP